jgi:hypothetical protein
MEEKPETQSVRMSQVMAGAMAAVTAAVLGSTMGFAGTVAGAGLASVVTTVGGALYLRSIQRTKQGVATVRDMVVARAGATSVTLAEERPATEAEAAAAGLAAPGEPGENTDDPATAEPAWRAGGDDSGDDSGERAEIVPPAAPARRKLRWPALIAASVLAFVLGMMVITGVEWLRGEPLSGGDGTTIGRIVREDSSGGTDDKDDKAPPATTTSTTTEQDNPTVTVTETPPTSGNEEPAPASSGASEPETTGPETTTDNAPTGSVEVPPTGQSG